MLADTHLHNGLHVSKVIGSSCTPYNSESLREATLQYKIMQHKGMRKMGYVRQGVEQDTQQSKGTSLGVTTLHNSQPRGGQCRETS